MGLGAPSSALVEINPASLTGHHALARFYQHVDAHDAARRHEESFQLLKNRILASGDGSSKRPYRLLSKADAELLVRSQGRSLVGGIYQSNESAALQLLLLSRSNDASPVTSDYFDLSPLLPAMSGRMSIQPQQAIHGILYGFLPTVKIQPPALPLEPILLNNDAMSLLLGGYSWPARRQSAGAYPIARIFWYQSGLTNSESASVQADTTLKTTEELTQLAVDHHIKAIGLGSTESMYTLGRLLLEDSNMPAIDQGNSPVFGAQTKRDHAVGLLEQAGSLGHAESLLYLGSQYRRGALLPASDDRANRLFAQAANLRNPKAIISYARYIAASPERQPEAPLIPLLEELADEGNAEAMVVMGNLYAKGISVKRSPRRAVRWYKKAVTRVQASHHGNAAIVNEVAWTLTVSDQKGLLKPGYAQAIMDTMMRTNKQVQNHPEYLDTWAATYAANGNFVKAIELQKRALHYARIQDRTDVIDILQTHLESFEAGANITE